MKKLITILMTVIMLISSIIVPVLADDGIKVLLNGQEISFDVLPQIIEGRTMVPMRAIFEALGYEITWLEDKQIITAYSKDTDVAIGMQIGYNGMLVTTGTDMANVESTDELAEKYGIEIDVPPCIVGGRTLVPVRAISEASNLIVKWNGNNRTVNLYDPDYAKLAYDDISKDILQIQEYISNGSYIEAMQLCETTKSFYNTSPEDIIILDNVYKLANSKYQEYLQIVEANKIHLSEGAPEQYGMSYHITTEQVIDAIYKKYGVVTEHTSTSNWFFEFSGNGLMFRVERWFDIPEISIDDLGLDEYFVYYDATNEVNQIRSYINQGLYLESIALCDKTSNHTLSHDDQDILSDLRSEANQKYNNYLEQQKAKNLSKTVTDYQKQVIYSTIKIFVSSRLKSSATAIWPSYNMAIYRYNEDGKIIATGQLEAMNGFGGYGKVYYTFLLNDDLSVDFWYIN